MLKRTLITIISKKNYDLAYFLNIFFCSHPQKTKKHSLAVLDHHNHTLDLLLHLEHVSDQLQNQVSCHVRLMYAFAAKHCVF